MNNNRNKKILVMMITSTLMTFPAWVNGQEPAAVAPAAAAADETGYEPASGETIPDISSEKTTAIKKMPAAAVSDKTKPVAETTAVDSGYTGYESTEELMRQQVLRQQHRKRWQRR